VKNSGGILMIAPKDYKVKADFSNSNDIVKIYMSGLNHRLLDREEELDLARRTVNGEAEAREKLILYNRRLVVNLAKKNYNKRIEFLDLIQEGNLGLITAADRVDPELGYKFSTYATWWIKQKIKRAVQASRTVAIPAYMLETIRKVNDLARIREISFLEACKRKKIRGERLENILSAARFLHEVSLSNADNREEEYKFDVMADEQKGEEGLDTELVMKEIEKLGRREKSIMKLRYGLCGEEELTLKETGKKVGVSNERVRQIQDEIIERIKGSMMDDCFGQQDDL
jgi:RNA polymerase primary sigma factor